MNDLRIPKAKVADYLDISTSSLDNKLKGRTEFKLTEVVKLSKWWKTPMDELAKGAKEIS